MLPAWRWLYWGPPLPKGCNHFETDESLAVSPFQWYVRGVLGVVLHGLPVECNSDELVQFKVPPGMTYVPATVSVA
jgi:hypothetical protein